MPHTCGTPDLIGSGGSSWGFSTLTWAIDQAIPQIKQSQFDLTEKVFDSISSVCGLQFKPVTNIDSAHLVFTTGRGRRANFDGPSGTLAYAYLPPSRNFRGKGLACVFDLDEDWQGQIKFVNVCCHEVGHMLGLSHSSASDGQKDLMDPTYDPAIATMQRGDIERLRRLYGPPKVKPEVPAEPNDGKLGLIRSVEVGLKINGLQIAEVDLMDFLK